MGLVLSRRAEQTVRIVVPPSSQPQTIEVKYLEQRGATARLNFTASKEISIVRGELKDESN
jgi:sRNA-binding carbon storage regulator CsrA